MRKQKKEFIKYSEAFKRQVVQEVLTGKLTKEAARIAYGIKSNCAILYWTRKYSGDKDYRHTHSKTNNLINQDEACPRLICFQRTVLGGLYNVWNFSLKILRKFMTL